MQKTLVIVKPDAVTQGYIGKILSRFESEGVKVVGLRMLHMSKTQAKGFYHVHQDKPFFDSLTDFMSSAPAVVVVLEGPDDIISRVRTVMGATNPKDAAEGTLRSLFATDVEKNAVHGSDSPESAATEIPYFFNALDLCRYDRVDDAGKDGQAGEGWEPLPPLK